jgi:uncharacterized protein (DUF362 family)/NAD-dependent dihydropyrimidine dehydrogenase PreA subunit
MKAPPLVAIERCETYHDQELDRVIAHICTAAQLPDMQGKRILLKPNILSDAAPERAVTTRPEVLAAIIRYCYRQGASEVLVGDSPGLQGPGFSPRNSGIASAIKAEGATWCDFAKNPKMYRIPGTFGLRLPLPKIFNDVDIIISVAKMKTHQLMYTTGSVKNLFGMVPGLHKSASHMRFPSRESFARMLAGLYSVIKPHAAIMDAVISMEGPGPAAGKPRHTGFLLASTDLSALDTAQAIIMGYDPLSIPLIRELRHRKLTHWDHPDDISYPLLDARDLIISDYRRITQEKKTHLISALLLPLFTRRLSVHRQQREPRPLFDRSRCTGCSRCVKICPAKALSLDNDRRIVVDYQSCIRCYCCHEVCPEDVITIESMEENR